MVMRSSLVALFFLVAFVYSFCFANVSVGEVLLRKKMTTHSRGWFRSIDLWVMGPARSRCATLLTDGLTRLLFPYYEYHEQRPISLYR